MTFLEAVEHYCEGLTVAVGCLGERCEHAVQEPDLGELKDAAEYLLLETDTDSWNTEEVHKLLGELREAVENRDPDHQCEPGFSSSQCDSCGSTLGGDREEAYGHVTKDPQQEPVKMSICVDCMMFHANGDVPEEWRQHA